jgi:hypothetical protein
MCSEKIVRHRGRALPGPYSRSFHEIRADPAPAGLQETYFLFGCALREGAASPGLQKEIQMALQPVEISRDSRVKNHRAVHMEHAKFEPFGEPIELDEKVQPETAASRWLMRIGAGVFWALALTIIVARGVYFEPGIFDGFGQALAFLQKLPGVL